MDATALLAAGRGLRCRAGECREAFHPGKVPSSGSHSQGIRRHQDAQVRELLATAELRNEHERAVHGYHHGQKASPLATPFSDRDGHSNKTLRWYLVPTE